MEMRFKSYEEVNEFLKGRDFKYVIPKLKNDEKAQYVYTVELSNNDKITECGVETIQNGFSVRYIPFYDVKRVNDFISLKHVEALKSRKKELLEQEEYDETELDEIEYELERCNNSYI